MKFRRIRNIRLSYEKQGQIFFAMANYRQQPKSARDRIDRLIMSAAGNDDNYNAALRRWLLEGVQLQRAAAEYYVREATIVEMRKKLYESW